VNDPKVRLTELSHGGGCGCKIAPAVLSAILAESPATKAFPNLLVGTENSDDAAVYKLNDTQALVATTDFFMPIVDDPYDFGRIAATNALSDIYAMGGTPIMALAIVGMPINKLPVETIQRIIAGGDAVCAAAGIPIAGGHSIDSPEPIYGLVALGLVHPDQVKRNVGAQAGDVLILGKAIGVGILSAALKKGSLSEQGYATMLHSTTQLNTPGIELAAMSGVHALTDVTGFGLLGHLLGICRGSRLRAEVDYVRLPILPMATELAEQGFITGASDRNLLSYREHVELPNGMPNWQLKLLADPQTSGGLLVACAPDVAGEVLNLFRRSGFAAAAEIGHFEAGAYKIAIR
jgi:selenide, water dikinase